MYQEPWHNPVPPGFTVPDYMSNTDIWTPRNDLFIVPSRLIDDSRPIYGWGDVKPGDNNLLTRHDGDGRPLGDQIVVTGRVTDSWGRPARNMLIEIWQTNASGKYVHFNDLADKPLDPNFLGAGRTFTDANGFYRFDTIKPGAYAWWRDTASWRAHHIHFSLYGAGLSERYVTQMLFEGDPLLARDPINSTIPDAKARDRMIARLDHSTTIPETAIGYRFDIVLGGPAATPEH